MAPIQSGVPGPGHPGCTPDTITILPNGKTAYVAAAGSAGVMLLHLPSLAIAGVVQTGAYPDGPRTE